MKSVDSSVLIAAFASWHSQQNAALEALQERPRLVGHCALETYSVLTRLPTDYRVPTGLVVQFLDLNFPDPPLTLDPTELRLVVPRLHSLGITGGAIYDGLIALTAAAHEATLITLDRRAEDTYRRCQVSYQFIG